MFYYPGTLGMVASAQGAPVILVVVAARVATAILVMMVFVAFELLALEVTISQIVAEGLVLLVDSPILVVLTPWVLLEAPAPPVVVELVTHVGPASVVDMAAQVVPAVMVIPVNGAPWRF